MIGHCTVIQTEKYVLSLGENINIVLFVFCASEGFPVLMLDQEKNVEFHTPSLCLGTSSLPPSLPYTFFMCKSHYAQRDLLQIDFAVYFTLQCTKDWVCTLQPTFLILNTLIPQIPSPLT